MHLVANYFINYKKNKDFGIKIFYNQRFINIIFL